MHLAAIDNMANSGNSFLHKAQPVVKIIMSAVIFTGIIISKDIIELSALILAVLIIMLLSRSDIKEILHLAIYPVFFSALFAILKFQSSWISGLSVILKSLGAALTVILLVATTSYTDIFAVFSIFMPSILIDVFIFTYRSLFILLERLENAIKIIKLRGGYRPSNLLFNIKSAAGIIGVALIHSFDMSERMYKIYSLRGYNGRIRLNRSIHSLKKEDILIALIAIAIIFLIIFI